MCPSSIKEATLSITTQPQSQSVCEAIGIATFTSQLNTTGFTGMVNYQWQNSKDGITWYNDLSGATTDGAATLTVSNVYSGNFKPFYRVIYSYNHCSTSLTATSTVATLTLTDAGLETVKAYPNSIKTGVATNVNFVFKGTAGAKISYTIAGVAQPVLTLPAGGVATITKSISAATNLVVTKIEGNCTVTNTNIIVKVAEEGATCDALPAPQFATVDNAKTILNGVEVTRSFAGGTPKITPVTAVGGYTCQPFYLGGYTWIGGTEGATKTTFTFSKPITKAEVWLAALNGAVAPQQPDKAKFTINCGTMSLSVTDCRNGGVSIQSGHTIITTVTNTSDDARVIVTSDKPFTELTVDGLDSGVGGYMVELCPTSIVPATLSITTQPVSKTACQGTAVTLTAAATLSNTTYQWQKQNGSTWVNVGSAQTTTNGTATLTLSTNTQTTAYRVIFSASSCGGNLTATSTVATVTVTTLAAPTVSSTTTLCPTAAPNSVSFASYVTPATGTTLRWYATATATTSSTTAPTINTNVTTRTTKTAYVRALNSNGCTSGVVTVTLTVDDTTAPTFNAPTALNIVCNSATATTAINNWLSTATATDACGAIATITNDYTAPANLCNVSGGVITVTFVAKDTFGNVLTKTSTIKLGVTPLTVVSDTFTVGNGLTATTTGSVLNNDRLNGNVPTAGPSGTVSITNITPAIPVRVGTNVPVLNANDGKVNVPANTPAGTYTISYRICEVANNNNCTSTTVTVKVVTPTITVTPESFIVTPTTSTQTIPNILNNDKIGGTVTPTVGVGGNVTLTVTNPSTPGNKPTLDPNTGEVTIPANTPAGNYTITYSYCEVLNPTNCTGLQTLVVTIMPTVVPVAVDDSATTAKGTPVTISVLANDTLNGAVTPTVVTHPTNGTAVENTNGTVEYRPYTGFVGTDSFVYEICNGTGCSSATVIVKITEDIIVYNGVSVNGNDKNNHFHIDGIENYPNNKVRIYNRWGVEVFSVEGYDNVTKVFKGISDGRVTIEASERLPQGTYYYIIEYVDEHNKKQTEVGWLYLKKN